MTGARDRVSAIHPVRRRVPWWVLLPVGAVAGLSAAQTPPFSTKSAVRVVVRSASNPGQAGAAASGFLWMQPNQVVTSLHAMTGSDITVKCGAKVSSATVAKVHEEADLVLLSTSENLSDCAVYKAWAPTKPAYRDVLSTYGFHSASGTSRTMTKEMAESETLGGLLFPPVKNLMAAFNIPSVTLPIYYVQGGLLPGYSGAPVVNASGQLVGIVDGGLNKGQDSYNWVIPAENLKALMESSQKTVPAKVPQAAADTTGQLFSTGIADDDASSAPKALVQDGRTHEFVKTKTMTLRQLAGSANDPVGVEKLYGALGSPIRMGTDWSIDIYEDPNEGIIIAVPSGQTLAYETPMPTYRYLKTSAVTREGKDASWNGYVQFEVMGTERILGADYSDRLSPAQLAQRAQTTLLDDCRNWSKPAPECEVDANSVRTFNFGQGKMLIKIGIKTRNKPPVLDTYDYYSFAIKGDKMLRAYSRIQWTRGRGEGLIECSARGATCNDIDGARTQFTNLMAANLTTFANLGRQIRQ